MINESIFESKRWQILKESVEWFEVLVYIIENTSENFNKYLVELKSDIADYDNEQYLVTKDKVLIEKELFTDIVNGEIKHIDLLLEAEKYSADLSSNSNYIVVMKIRHAGYKISFQASQLSSTTPKIYKVFYKGEVLVDLSATGTVLKELEYNELWKNIKSQITMSVMLSNTLYNEEKDETARKDKLAKILKQKGEMINGYVQLYHDNIEKINQQ